MISAKSQGRSKNFVSTVRLSLRPAERILIVKLLQLLDVHPRMRFADLRQQRQNLGIRQRLDAILLHETATVLIDESDTTIVGNWKNSIAAIADHLK
jgi:hypothetical protein